MKAKVNRLFLFFFAIVFAGAGFYFYHNNRSHQQDLPKNVVVLQVSRHTTARSFVHFLKVQNRIHCESCFLFWLRLRHLSTQLKAGYYQISPDETASMVLARVVRGDVMKAAFTIVDGTTWFQVREHLKQAPYLNYTDDDVSSIQANDLQSNEHMSVSSLEGLFLADTYQYITGSCAKAMLMLAHRDLKNALYQAWNQREQDLPYRSPYELLIVASILQKESSLSLERQMISGIVVNRLRQHMPLQMDPTVIYGLGTRYTGILSHQDLQDDSPYNTYRHFGLPPTPIAMVGLDAIHAAAHPTKTNNLYFVAKGDGTHVFSETYDAQRRAIQSYIRKKE